MSFRLTLALAACSLVGAGPALAAAPGPDRLAESLDSLGLSRSRIGTRPEGYWTRFPRPEQVPHLLASFPSLFAEPLRLYDFGRTLGNAAGAYLDPARPDTPSALHHLIYFLGVEKRVGGFRNYTTNLAPPDTAEPTRALVRALEELWLRDDQLTSYRTFGAATEWQNVPDSQITLFVAGVPEAFHTPLAACLSDLSEAGHWWRVALRRVPEELRRGVLAIDDLSDSQGDGTRYYAALDDASALVDEHSLYYAGMKCAAAAERLAHALTEARLPREWTSQVISTPLGRVVLGSSGSDVHDGPSLLVFDPRGNDTYSGRSGAAFGTDRPLSVIVDTFGDDVYRSDSDGAQGSATLGCAVLYDARGNDRYFARNAAQGYGLLGLGVLFDRSGNDVFDMRTGGQGCGYFGVGLLLDGGGTDTCRIWAEGQGQGGVGGGVGVLAAYGGNDLYYAEPDAEIAGRADYHSEHKITANNVQGSGTGRRGDGSDGHSWAGGLGALIDVGGNDRYEAGNWCQAIGYWFGTGILYDSEGDDVYRSVYFSQASGAHFCNAALIDEAGDDRHELWFNRGASIAFGWDYSNILLVDKAGNDLYDGGESCVGLSTGRSHVLLYDRMGDDEYRLNAGSAGFGQAAPRDDFFKPDPFAPYMFYSTSWGQLLDCGGEDRYLRMAKDSTWHPDSLAGEAAFWRQPADTAGGLFGGGFDAEGGGAPDFEWWDSK